MQPSDQNRAIRAAHVNAALYARRTSHEWLRLAREWPKDAKGYLREADKCRERARWHIERARGLDAWAEWKRDQMTRIAA